MKFAEPYPSSEFWWILYCVICVSPVFETPRILLNLLWQLIQKNV
jgi:hypothetical protein